MFGLMLKSTHEEKMRNAKASEDQRRETDFAYFDVVIGDEQAASARLRAQIKEMTPDYELGKKRRAQYEKHNARRKERRAARRAGV
jgi:hypothetical protein